MPAHRAEAELAIRPTREVSELVEAVSNNALTWSLELTIGRERTVKAFKCRSVISMLSFQSLGSHHFARNLVSSQFSLDFLQTCHYCGHCGVLTSFSAKLSFPPLNPRLSSYPLLTFVLPIFLASNSTCSRTRFSGARRLSTLSRV